MQAIQKRIVHAKLDIYISIQRYLNTTYGSDAVDWALPGRAPIRADNPPPGPPMPIGPNKHINISINIYTTQFFIQN